jgi:CRP-like cAMP-binding protein
VRAKQKLHVDPEIFLRKIGAGGTTAEYQKDEMIFSQGDAANDIFYIQRGKLKLTVVSRQG